MTRGWVSPGPNPSYIPGTSGERHGIGSRTLAIGPARSGGGGSRRSCARTTPGEIHLDHDDLAGALAFQIGHRLGADDDERARFTRVAQEAFAAAPELVEAASLDLQGIVEHDPAVTALLPPLLNYKGFVALEAWRVQNWLWQRGRHDFARMMQSASPSGCRSASIPRLRSAPRCTSITRPASSSAPTLVSVTA